MSDLVAVHEANDSADQTLMAIKIQPREVRRKNAKLIALAMLLSIPFYYWVFMTDLDHAPRWLPITVLSLNMGVVIPALIIARRYMNKKNGADNTPTVGTD